MTTTLAAALEADRAFAAHARDQGLKAAFLRFFDPEGEFFGPGVATKGAAAIAAGFDNAAPGFVIAWSPESGHGAAGGDLAVTTGRYRVTMGEVQVEVGRYFSVWRRDLSGVLKVVMQNTLADPPAP